MAGAPEYVFNEYLQVAMAWGVPALCGILFVVVGCFCLGHQARQSGICGGLLSLDPWTARRSNQSILKEIIPEYSLEGLMLKLKL